jgi:hypothetical protein
VNALTTTAAGVNIAKLTWTASYQAASALLKDLDYDDEVSLKHLTHTDQKGDKGRPVLLSLTDTEADRWRLGNCAKHKLAHLPAHAEVTTALLALRRDLEAEPTLEAILELIEGMLAVQGIEPNPAYVGFLATKLRDCAARSTETKKRWHPWFPLPAIAAGIDQVLETLWPESGRPLAIGAILDVVGKVSSEMHAQHRRINELAWAQHRLALIVDATKDAQAPSAADDDDGADIPEDDDDSNGADDDTADDSGADDDADDWPF